MSQPLYIDSFVKVWEFGGNYFVEKKSTNRCLYHWAGTNLNFIQVGKAHFNTFMERNNATLVGKLGFLFRGEEFGYCAGIGDTVVGEIETTKRDILLRSNYWLTGGRFE